MSETSASEAVLEKAREREKEYDWLRAILNNG
jgi:hypothetical protein